MLPSLRRSQAALLLAPAALLWVSPPLLGAQAGEEEREYGGESADRYAMIRALEGDVTIRKGEAEETLSPGTPVAEGDLIESHGRGVLQLGDGTRVAFGGSTRLQVAALFTAQGGERQILLRLDYGRLRVQMAGGGDVRLRVDTSSGSATMLDRGLFSLEAERDRTVRARVVSGRLSFTNNRDEVRLGAGERVTTFSSEDRLGQIRTFNTYDQDSFEAWADTVVQARRGESYQRVPREIRHYADELDGRGEWVEDSEAGWVWRPQVEVEWRPYWRGRWGCYAGGLTWVSDDPWGYVTFHFGRWGWSNHWGWYWIPGVYYSPAWVAWPWNGGQCGWAPLDYWNSPCHWGYGGWSGYGCWNVVNVTYINQPALHHHIYSDAHVMGTFSGGRDLRAPWTRGPVVATSAEFRNPAQLSVAFRADIHRERIQAYDHQIQASTGRAIVRREAPSPVGGVPTGSPRLPFADRRPIPTSPREHGGLDRPAPQLETSPRERGGLDRPAPSVPRPEASPRGRGFEVRPADPPREAPRPAPADQPRERPREGGVENRPVDSPRERPRERGFENRPSDIRRDDRRSESPREYNREERPRDSNREERPRERGPENRPPAPPREERRAPQPAPRERATESRKEEHRESKK